MPNTYFEAISWQSYGFYVRAIGKKNNSSTFSLLIVRPTRIKGCRLVLL